MKRLLLVLAMLLAVSSANADPYELPAGTKAWGGVSGWKSDINKIFNYFGATDGDPETNPELIGPLTISGTGNSYLAMPNNTTFDDVITGLYLWTFYEGHPYTALNGMLKRLALFEELGGGAAPTIQADDPTIADATGEYIATTSGDRFYVVRGIGVQTIAGTWVGDDTDPTVGIVTSDPATHDGTGTAIEVTVASITETNESTRQYRIYDVTSSAVEEAYQTFTGLTINETLPADQHTYRFDILVTDLAGNVGTESSSNIVYDAGGCADQTCSGFIACQNYENTGYDNSESYTEYLTGGGAAIDEDSTTNPLRGSQSIRMYAGTTGNYAWAYRALGSSITSASIHFKFRTDDATPTASVAMAAFRTTSGNDDIMIGLSTDGHLRAQHGSTLATGSATISNATIHHVWADFVNGAGSGILAVYTSTTRTKPASPDITITTGTNNTALDRFGFWSQAALTMDYDQLLIHANEIGDVCE